MSPGSETNDNALLESLTKIVTVYLERNSIQPEQVPVLIDGIFKVLLRVPEAVGASVAAPAAVTATEPAQQLEALAPSTPPQPAVPVEQSITPEYLICLEDGARQKLLKRYLQRKYNLTPRQYRERWGLPKDYPMVAPGYSERRSAAAKAIGLGTRRTSQAPAAAVSALAEAVEPPPGTTSPVAAVAEPAVRRKRGRAGTAAATASTAGPAAEREGVRRGRRTANKGTAPGAKGEAIETSALSDASAEKKESRRRAAAAAPSASKPRGRKAENKARAT
jgi:predicted transcriptional regulator